MLCLVTFLSKVKGCFVKDEAMMHVDKKKGLLSKQEKYAGIRREDIP